MVTAGESPELRKGLRVKVKGQRLECEVLDGPNSRGEWQVIAGSIKLWVQQSMLIVVPGSPGAHHSAKRSRAPRLSGESGRSATVDLHGQTVSEAKENLAAALDRALRDDADHLDIIHGIGSGALRKAVHEMLRGSRQVKRFELTERNKGTTRAWL